jgi:hypothetical protein
MATVLPFEPLPAKGIILKSFTIVFSTAQATSAESSTTSSGDVLENHGDYYTVTNGETGIFGTGATPDDAFSDFAHALREHLDVLERQEALTQALQAQLRYLRRRFTR